MSTVVLQRKNVNRTSERPIIVSAKLDRTVMAKPFSSFLRIVADRQRETDPSPCCRPDPNNVLASTRAEAAAIYIYMNDSLKADNCQRQLLRPMHLAARQRKDFEWQITSSGTGDQPLSEIRETWYNRTATLAFLVVPGLAMSGRAMAAVRLVRIWLEESMQRRELFFDEAQDICETYLFASPFWSLGTFLQLSETSLYDAGQIRSCLQEMFTKTFEFVPQDLWCYFLITGGIVAHLGIRDVALVQRALDAAKIAEPGSWEDLYQKILAYKGKLEADPSSDVQ